MPEFSRQEKEIKKVYPKQFKMVKNYSGAFATKLEPYDYSAPAREIIFKHDEESQLVPAKYALGAFISNTNIKEMGKGYFTFENLETLKEMAEEEGLFVPTSLFTQSQPTFREIKEALASGDVKQVEALIERSNSKTLLDIQSFARKMHSSLNMSVVGLLKEKFQVSLEPIDLDN